MTYPHAIITLCLSLCVSACSPLYVLRAGYEEARILWRRQPITQLLQDDTVELRTREQLRLVLAARDFAAHRLGLRAGGSYTTYARLDDDQVVHVVTAAPAFELRPYTWWFPIVGHVPYKGYFSKEQAQALAQSLRDEGYDTHVRTAGAFSTLGWFDDPLLSTLIDYQPPILANVVIHELTHSTRYVSGHGAFNESFAQFVGYRGAHLFFTERGDTEAAELLENIWHDALLFSRFLHQFTEDLRTLYAQPDVTHAQRAAAFAHAQTELKEVPFKTNRYASFSTIELNNAIILHHMVYADRLWLFEELLQQHHGDVPRTIATLLHTLDQTNLPPFEALENLLNTPPSVLIPIS